MTQAVILLAGYGSRLQRPDLPHKSLLAFDGGTLLSRHIACLGGLPVDEVVLVLGHNKEAVKQYVRALRPPLPVRFVDNEVYLTTGNTLSLVMGLREVRGDALILDGDVLYPFTALRLYAQQSAPSSFAVTPVDINDKECTKVLLRKNDGSIHAFVTKRHVTAEERAAYACAGEAIGFFKLGAAAVKRFVDFYARHEAEYVNSLWEIPFSDFAQTEKLMPWHISEPGCFEIDTAEDYQEALGYFGRNRGAYS